MENEQIINSKHNNAVIEAYEKGYRVVGGKVFYKNKERKLCLNNGYYKFGVRANNGQMINVKVHKLMAYQKFGNLMFEQGIEVRHLDSNSMNNLENNIDIGTSAQNAADKTPQTRLKAALTATNAIRKHSHSDILDMHNRGLSYRNIMKETGIKSKGTISFIIKQSMTSKGIDIAGNF